MCWNYNDREIRLRLEFFSSGITRRPVPLFGLPRPDTVRPHRRLDGVGPNLFATFTQFLTAAFWHRRYANIRNNEASLPLHTRWPSWSGTLTYPNFLPILTDGFGYRHLGITKSGITGRPVPLSGLPRPQTVRPHRQLDGVSPNLFATLIQSFTAVFWHRRYANIRNNEASLPLHTRWPSWSGTLTYPNFLPILTDGFGYRHLGITKSGITGRPVPLSGLPRPQTMRPHRQLDDVSPNLFATLTQSFMAAFSHRRYACIWNSKASLPLHLEIR